MILQDPEANTVPGEIPSPLSELFFLTLHADESDVLHSIETVRSLYLGVFEDRERRSSK